MPSCGSFSHDLLEVRDRATWEGMRFVRCTIVAIDAKTNTADVELGEDPPAGVPAGELTDIDCPDVPVFDGDGWSADGHRRRCHAVPIYYHCQGSTGTIEELKTGYLAFRVPPAEFTEPPFTSEEVAKEHDDVLREKALMLFVPPTNAETAQGIKGYRYIIGHTDRNDIAPCKSEYLCLRLTYAYDTAAQLPGGTEYDLNPDFGWSKFDDVNIVSIIDPVLGKVYDGLAPWGITFPCSAKSIIDRVQVALSASPITSDNLLFLDTLYSINALYDQSFYLQQPSLSPLPHSNVTSHRSYSPTAGCHDHNPVRLCWLSHHFDYGLQCEITSTDPRNFQEPCDYANIHEEFLDQTSGDNVITNYHYKISYGERNYTLYPGSGVYESIDSSEYFETNLPSRSEFTNTILNQVDYDPTFTYIIYTHTIRDRGNSNWTSTSKAFSGWVVSWTSNVPLELCYYSINDYHLYDAEAHDNIETGTETHTVNLSFFCPWVNGPWYNTGDMAGLTTIHRITTINSEGYAGIEVLDKYSGNPYSCPGNPQAGSVPVYGESYMVGEIASYSLNIVIYYYDGMSFDLSEGTYDNGVYKYHVDKTKYKVKASFGHNPQFHKGMDGAPDYSWTGNLDYLKGASETLEKEIAKMYELYRIAFDARMEIEYDWEYYRWRYASAEFSAFVINVVE